MKPQEQFTKRSSGLGYCGSPSNWTSAQRSATGLYEPSKQTSLALWAVGFAFVAGFVLGLIVRVS